MAQGNSNESIDWKDTYARIAAEELSGSDDFSSNASKMEEILHTEASNLICHRQFNFMGPVQAPVQGPAHKVKGEIQQMIDFEDFYIANELSFVNHFVTI